MFRSDERLRCARLRQDALGLQRQQRTDPEARPAGAGAQNPSQHPRGCYRRCSDLMSVFVVRAFVKMRSAFKDSRELTQKLALLEQELKIRLNIHEAAIVDVPI